MKYWLAVIVLSSAVAASAQTLPVPALPDLVPAPQETLACGPWQQTALHTAGGSTCAQATSALHGVLTGAADCGGCGFCSQTFIDKACNPIQGGFSVSGYLRYRCQLCPA